MSRGVFPPPWSSYCEGGPGAAGMTYGGAPVSRSVVAVSSLASADSGTVIPSLQMLLRTTRQRQIEGRKDEWRRKRKRKNVPGAETAKMATSMGPTTLFDVGWRLRKRGDYEDADAFVDGIPTQADATAFSEALIHFTSGSLAVLAALTASYLGRKDWCRMADAFTGVLAGPECDDIRVRTDAIR